MRRAYVHVAVLGMRPDAELRAPGAAITAALCGDWGHEPPCPLAPHHTRAERTGDRVLLRTLFATGPAAEQTVRDRIDHALTGGRLRGPDATVTHWRLLTSGPADVTPEEAARAERLA
ncbi:hypothetical protein ABZ611_00300 [Streptomyces sp. NPDC007861]|uniref:hypothetical protein n=1 Tax=Streptomyces sp. NPDC007861 TaxID=3154893 RepID=UPI0033CAAB0A